MSYQVPYKFPVKQQQKQVMYNDPFTVHKISNIILGCKLHSEKSRTKQLTLVKLDFTLFWMCLAALLGTLFLTAGTVLSISFEVDLPTGKVGDSLHVFFEYRRRELPRGVWGCAPPENFEIQMLGNAIFNVFQTVFGPKR